MSKYKKQIIMDKELRNHLQDEVRSILKKFKEKEFTIQTRKVPRIKLQGDRGYGAEYENVPQYGLTFTIHEGNIIESRDITEIEKLWSQKYPHLTRFIIVGGASVEFSIKGLLKIISIGVLKRDPALKEPDGHISEELDELAISLKEKKAKKRLVSLIANLNVEGDQTEINIDKGIKIRKLSEEEINKYHDFDIFPMPLLNLERAAIIIEYEDDIMFPNLAVRKTPPTEAKIPEILRIVLHSVNLVKSGAVGVTWQRMEQGGYFGKFVSGGGRGNIIPLIGQECRLTANEIPELILIYKKIKLSLEPFEFALSRLSEAERRRNPQDSIVDAVIGLESLLLNDVTNEKYRGEMRYRFSINYATLFDSEERLARRKIALDAYDLRSQIVHGGRPDPSRVKLGTKKVTIGKAAEEIRDTLRYTLKYLIDLPPERNFNSEGFWINRLLKL